MARSTILAGALTLFGTRPALAAGELKLEPDPFTLLVNLVVLALLIYPVNRLLLRPLVAVLQEREERTAGASEHAERLLAEAAQCRDEVEHKLGAAREAAQARRAAVLAEAVEEERRVIGAARDDANREIEAVRGSISDELESAREMLRAEARTLASEASARILGRAL